MDDGRRALVKVEDRRHSEACNNISYDCFNNENQLYDEDSIRKSKHGKT